ncbi:hypothetical protein DFH08DRAFT_944542 [Mycena albidolilacea]|uniref:Uncharacterized protein n=1 Tax=Mycena albidolilacea TaxID=1033008 RepID=A0AAD6Z5A6_9AGAR|nr:hypothetical protein DFH08DRAFT_944542 [Mycena albidolilacea]
MSSRNCCDSHFAGLYFVDSEWAKWKESEANGRRQGPDRLIFNGYAQFWTQLSRDMTSRARGASANLDGCWVQNLSKCSGWKHTAWLHGQRGVPQDQIPSIISGKATQYVTIFSKSDTGEWVPSRQSLMRHSALSSSPHPVVAATRNGRPSGLDGAAVGGGVCGPARQGGIDQHIVSIDANGSKAEEIHNRLVLVHGKQGFLAILCQSSDEDGIPGGWGLSSLQSYPLTPSPCRLSSCVKLDCGVTNIEVFFPERVRKEGSYTSHIPTAIILRFKDGHDSPPIRTGIPPNSRSAASKNDDTPGVRSLATVLFVQVNQNLNSAGTMMHPLIPSHPYNPVSKMVNILHPLSPATDAAAREGAAAEAAAQAEREADQRALEAQQAAADAEARAVKAAAQLEVAADGVAVSVEESKDAAAIEKEIKAKEEAVKKAEAATAKAEAKSAAAKAKAAAKEAAALERAKAEYEKEVEHLTKLAAQKRDDAIKAAGAELTKAVTNASIIRRKEEASAQSARAKADEAAARARLEAEKSAWKGICFLGGVDCVPTNFVGAYEERQSAEKDAEKAFAKAAKLATAEREKAEKEAEVVRKAAIKAILAKRDKAFLAAEDAKSHVEREVEREEAAANNLKAGEAEGVQLPQTMVEWLGSFIWGGRGLAPETEGAAK